MQDTNILSAMNLMIYKLANCGQTSLQQMHPVKWEGGGEAKGNRLKIGLPSLSPYLSFSFPPKAAKWTSSNLGWAVSLSLFTYADGVGDMERGKAGQPWLGVNQIICLGCTLVRKRSV